jgi:hypothetical protein
MVLVDHLRIAIRRVGVPRRPRCKAAPCFNNDASCTPLLLSVATQKNAHFRNAKVAQCVLVPRPNQQYPLRQYLGILCLAAKGRKFRLDIR